jgi:hypothetical protein
MNALCSLVAAHFLQLCPGKEFFYSTMYQPSYLNKMLQIMVLQQSTRATLFCTRNTEREKDDMKKVSLQGKILKIFSVAIFIIYRVAHVNGPKLN